MSGIRCSHYFHSIKVNDFPVFAGGVRDGIYNNAITFVNPPISQVDFQALLDSYNNTRYAYEQGGIAQRGPYRDAKIALMKALDELADYVDGIADGNANIITLAGYVPTKSSRSATPEPADPIGISLKRASSGVLLAECATQDNTVSYGCILTANYPLEGNVIMNEKGQLLFLDDSDPKNPNESAITPLQIMIQGVFDCNPGRKKEFKNLNPGTTYYVVFYAANSAGVSEFSKTVSLMCG